MKKMSYAIGLGNILQPILLLLLSITVSTNPISSPEILSNSVKSTELNSQEAQLNSLNAYAVNYGQILPKTTENTHTTNNFKPSYKISQLENNFVPIQNNPAPKPAVSNDLNSNTASAASISQSSPVLMQYVPQLMNEGGMQYLQLIPTRPLIVPIGPFINGGAFPTAAAYGSTDLPSGNAGRSAAIYTSITGHNQRNNSQSGHFSTSIVKIPSNISAGIQYTYGNSQPTHSRNNFRINREVKGKQPPPGLSLNINEFIPLNPEALNGLHIRGRP